MERDFLGAIWRKEEAAGKPEEHSGRCSTVLL
jgi:hypothetical protein